MAEPVFLPIRSRAAAAAFDAKDDAAMDADALTVAETNPDIRAEEAKKEATVDPAADPAPAA
eukprot:CAMPEP_0113625288 /NCGR_PEP_ID=MMETSP0017_2-20120614/13062_1 /TAXON_ID=2856 /ORGANISM="Cylindrotheca closterium" /LENGTH=61 /DNA_ID=CAMNT_0000535397 /DNA_START=1104 /DNA_END=1286 /DNA_ORIENTATION=+ /assembly_acc=CAM_ASM_000147